MLLQHCNLQLACHAVFIISCGFDMAAHGLTKGSLCVLCKLTVLNAVPQLYVKNFLTPGTARKLYKWCLESLPWYLVRYEIRQTSITTPRFASGSIIPAA